MNKTNAVFAAEEAMIAIESELPNYKNSDTVTVADDGYIGIPIEAATYYDSSFGDVIDNYGGTMIFLYVVNTAVERVGTDSDVIIIKSMLDIGYIVTVID